MIQYGSSEGIRTREENILRTVEWLKGRQPQPKVAQPFVITKSTKKNKCTQCGKPIDDAGLCKDCYKESRKRNAIKHTCIDCGTEVQDEGRCLACYKKARREHADISAAKPKMKHNNCIDCGKPIEKTGRCIDCYKKYQKTVVQTRDGFMLCVCGKEIPRSSRLCWSCRKSRGYSGKAKKCEKN